MAIVPNTDKKGGAKQSMNARAAISLVLIVVGQPMSGCRASLVVYEAPGPHCRLVMRQSEETRPLESSIEAVDGVIKIFGSPTFSLPIGLHQVLFSLKGQNEEISSYVMEFFGQPDQEYEAVAFWDHQLEEGYVVISNNGAEVGRALPGLELEWRQSEVEVE